MDSDDDSVCLQGILDYEINEWMSVQDFIQSDDNISFVRESNDISESAMFESSDDEPIHGNRGNNELVIISKSDDSYCEIVDVIANHRGIMTIDPTLDDEDENNLGNGDL